MRTTVSFFSLLLFASVALCQGFSSTVTNWSTPVGGQYSSTGTNLGLLSVGSSAYTNNNSQTWSMLDMNGDGQSDLVITSQYSSSSNNHQQFGAGSNPYWKVYLSNGTDFATTVTNWFTPVGGQYSSTGTNLGLLSVGSNAYTNNLSQTWNMADMDGDARPDLVITSQYSSSSNNHQQFGAGSNPYWKVYLNTGTGFSSTVTNWSTPVGGQYSSTGTNLGLLSVASSAYTNNLSQTWSMADMDGDAKADLIITSQYYSSSNNHQQFGAGSNPYWKVYLSNGTDFASTVTNWSTPVGGQYSSTGTNLGLLSAGSSAYTNNLSQTWSMADMDGDGMPDLVITSQYSSSSNNHQQFGAGSTPYWKVYRNNGTDFATSVSNWFTPIGGQYSSTGTNLGLLSLASSAYTNNNSQSWSTTDLNADGRADVVITSQYSSSSNNHQQFGAGSNPYWKVYLNDGSDFASAVTNWFTPVGGQYSSTGMNLGLLSVGSSAYTNNLSQTWSIADMDGDENPDLVICSQYSSSSNNHQQFGAGSNPYWKVYLNTSPAGNIDDLSATDDGVTVFPNPFSNVLYIQSELNMNNQPYVIRDPEGRIVVSGFAGGNLTGLDLSQIPRGMYLLEIGDKAKQTAKIIRQ